MNMDATEEWLRYIESKTIIQEYGINGYTNDENEEELEDEKQN